MPGSKLRVLTYHRVAEPDESPWLNPALISAYPAEFERQMTHLARRYSVVSAGEVLAALDNGHALPPRAVLITFDDAYLDFLDHAWPVLRGLGLPATVFVPTAFADDPRLGFWSDRLHRAFSHSERDELPGTPLGTLRLSSREERRRSLKLLQDHLKSTPHAEAAALVDHICSELGPQPPQPRSVMGWDRLRELAARGISLGGHTRNHKILTEIPPKEQLREVEACQRDLRRETGQPALPIFCYPNGSHDDSVVAAAREAGIRLAFTTLDGHNRLRRTDPLRFRRTNITPRTSGLVFRTRLSSWAARVDAWRHR